MFKLHEKSGVHVWLHWWRDGWMTVRRRMNGLINTKALHKQPQIKYHNTTTIATCSQKSEIDGINKKTIQRLNSRDHEYYSGCSVVASYRHPGVFL